MLPMTTLTLTRTVQPAKQPVTLAEAKEQCRVAAGGTDFDAELFAYIEAAVQMAEDYQGRQFITATYTLSMEDFPDLGGGILLPRPPVQSVVSINYKDASGDTQTLSASQYSLVKGSVAGCVVPASGTHWPQVYSHDGAENVTITFVAGYGDDAADVPATTRQAVKMYIADLFENHESIVTGGSFGTNRTAEMLLNLNRIPPVA